MAGGERTLRLRGAAAGAAGGGTALSDEDDDAPHPRHTEGFFGNAAAEQALLDAYRSGRMPHAWLIGGPQGVGKATLAYRLARFVLAHPDPSAPAVQGAATLAVDAQNGAFRRVAAEAHPDLLALYRTIGDTGKLRSNITVDQVRRTVGFFGSTAGEGGWRICIVDTADELHGEGANALLKIIEEPPARSLLLLISHAPGRLLPTIRSRCRRLLLRPLAVPEVVAALAAVTGRETGDTELQTAAAASEGSPGRALALVAGENLALRERVDALLARLPSVDPLALHGLGDDLAGTDAGKLATFADAAREWLSAQVARHPSDLPRLAAVAEVWEKVNRAARDAETYNLDRKPLVFSVFGWLAGAAR